MPATSTDSLTDSTNTRSANNGAENLPASNGFVKFALFRVSHSVPVNIDTNTAMVVINVQTVSNVFIYVVAETRNRTLYLFELIIPEMYHCCL